MAAFEILSVALPEQPSAGLLDFELAEPRSEETSELHAVQVSGWVLGDDRSPTVVEVRHDERVVQSAPVLGAVENVARWHPELRVRHPDVSGEVRCGFEALVGLVGLASTFQLELVVVFDDGSRVRLATVEGRREPVRSSYEPRLLPLMVTSPGRTGTTWLMKMLTGHPRIVVHDVYPYESWAAKYWAHAFKVLTDPANTVHSGRVHGFDIDSFHAGSNPFFTARLARNPELGPWLGRSHVERLAAFVQETIDDWYLTIARMQGSEDPAFFAEKQMTRPSFTPPLVWELYPRAKEVFLVRDFRDMACSKIAFNTAEPGLVKGQLAGKTQEEYLRQNLRSEALAFQRAWRARRDRGHLMRYEDLVFHPLETLSALLDYLGLERDAVETMLAATPDIQVHRTAPDLEASVGRWWREGDDAFQALCQEVFVDVLEEFGYSDRAGEAPAPAPLS